MAKKNDESEMLQTTVNEDDFDELFDESEVEVENVYHANNKTEKQ